MPTLQIKVIDLMTQAGFPFSLSMMSSLFDGLTGSFLKLLSAPLRGKFWNSSTGAWAEVKAKWETSNSKEAVRFQ